MKVYLVYTDHPSLGKILLGIYKSKVDALNRIERVTGSEKAPPAYPKVGQQFNMTSGQTWYAEERNVI